MTLLAAAIALTGACGSVGDPGASVSASESPSSSVATIGTAEAQRLGRTFVAFALEPSPALLADVPFAPEVQLGLRDAIDKTVPRAKLADKASWRIDREEFAAMVGPFDATATLRQFAGIHTEIDPFTIGVGDYPHCNNRQTFRAPEVAGLARVTIQPRDGMIDSCISWFSVDLFVDNGGEIAAVTMDHGEP